MRDDLDAFHEFLRPDFFAAGYDAFDLHSSSSTLIDTHCLLVRVASAPNPTNDPSLSYSILSVTLESDNDVITILPRWLPDRADREKDLKTLRLPHGNASRHPAALPTRNAVVVYFNKQHKLGGFYIAQSLDVSKVPEIIMSKGAERSRPSTYGLLKPGRDWKEMLMERSRISAVEIRNDPNGLYPKMTFREWKRWCDNVSGKWGVAGGMSWLTDNLVAF